MLRPIPVQCAQCGLVHYSDESLPAYGKFFCSQHCLKDYEAVRRTKNLDIEAFRKLEGDTP